MDTLLYICIMHCMSVLNAWGICHNQKLCCFLCVGQADWEKLDVACARSPAATADHMTKNIPTAILFREEGSRPRRFRMGSTTLSFRGISMRMSTASNMVSQAAGKRNVIWSARGRQREWERECAKSNKGMAIRGEHPTWFYQRSYAYVRRERAHEASHYFSTPKWSKQYIME